MPKFLNIAAYRFVGIESSELQPMREELKALCDESGLKGTILLSPEGINFFVSGTSFGISALRKYVNADTRFADMEEKKSFSDYQPFSRMLVKVKSEIIAFGIDGIEPERMTAPRLTPEELKSWIDAGKPVTLLDVRNRYETKLGTFRNAVEFDIDVFRSFPKALDERRELDKSSPVVTFCTGGIRCEKASALMIQEGFHEVYQLHGGILQYFKDCGGEHYEGECFVYDQRVSLNADLDETNTVQCFNCNLPVTPEEQVQGPYLPPDSCPHCISGKPQKNG